MVGSVHVLMAVLARMLDHAIARTRTELRVAQVVERARMARVQMAALTEIRHLRDQQLVVIRAVRLMARRAVLADRRVLPQERPALLGVAGVAELIQRIGFEHAFRR